MRRYVVFMAFFMVAVGFVLGQPKELPTGAKCVICGMKITTESPLVVQMKLKDGSYIYAGSPKHAMRYYLKNKEKIAQIWVKDFKTGKWIDGRKAYYVIIKEGPAGKDLAPFRSMLKARKFAKGKKILKFSQINNELLEHLGENHEGNMKHSH